MSEPKTLFHQFQKFLQDHEVEFADLYILDDKTELGQLISKDVQKQIEVVARHASGSIICSVVKDKEKELDKQPVAWIDSEGWPRNVFANNFSEFLSLIMYGSGMIYDVISSVLNHQENPENTLPPNKFFPEDYFRRILKENQKMSSAYKEYAEWLKNEVNIRLAERPLELITRSVMQHKDFKF